MTLSQAGSRITDVAGITVGHHHQISADATVAVPGGAAGSGWATGTTVIGIDAPGAVCAVDVRGGGPGTRETDLLDPVNTVQTAHAIVLTGGSAFGLSSADGVMTALESDGIGLPMDDDGHVVPIVPAAVIFDLPVGDWSFRPDPSFGLAAVSAATTDFAVGSVGAGAGARAGALKGGVGTASTCLSGGAADGLTVGAVVVANPVGAVIDPRTGLPWATSEDDLESFGLRPPVAEEVDAYAALAAKQTVLNTTIGVIATDAPLDPASARRMAISGHDGLARAITPAHSPLDGDTLFAVATGTRRPPPQPDAPAGMNPDVAMLAELCRVAADVVRAAVIDAVLAAVTVAGIPTYRDVVPSARGGLSAE